MRRSVFLIETGPLSGLPVPRDWPSSWTGILDDLVQSRSNLRVWHLEVWKILSTNWSRGFQLVQRMNYLHFLDPQHGIRWKIRTGSRLIFEPSFCEIHNDKWHCFSVSASLSQRECVGRMIKCARQVWNQLCKSATVSSMCTGRQQQQCREGWVWALLRVPSIIAQTKNDCGLRNLSNLLSLLSNHKFCGISTGVNELKSRRPFLQMSASE